MKKKLLSLFLLFSLSINAKIHDLPPADLDGSDSEYTAYSILTNAFKKEPSYVLKKKQDPKEECKQQLLNTEEELAKAMSEKKSLEDELKELKMREKELANQYCNPEIIAALLFLLGSTTSFCTYKLLEKDMNKNIAIGISASTEIGVINLTKYIYEELTEENEKLSRKLSSVHSSIKQLDTMLYEQDFLIDFLNAKKEMLEKLLAQ